MQGPGWAENTMRGTTGWRTERGRAERSAWQEGKTEWKVSGQGMTWQGKATYGRARNGIARQEHIQRRAELGSGRGSGSGKGRGMSRFKAGQDRAG